MVKLLFLTLFLTIKIGLAEDRNLQLSLLLASEASLIVDQDQDGINDRFDWDLDSDLVANIIDQFPYAPYKGNTDLNIDGISDYLQIVSSPQKQLDIFNQTQIPIIEFKSQFNSSQWEMLEKTLSLKLFKLISFELKAIVKLPVDNERYYFAQYDRLWRYIVFYDNSYHQNPYAFQTTLLHELFHVIETTNKDSVQPLLDWCEQTGEVKISLKSSQNASECFAEIMTYYFAKKENIQIDQSRFKDINNDEVEQIAKRLLESIESGDNDEDHD